MNTAKVNLISTKFSFVRYVLGIALFVMLGAPTEADTSNIKPETRIQIASVKSSFTLRAGMPILVAADAPQPVRRALQDLQRDLKRVLGVDSPIINSTAQLAGRSGIVVIGSGSDWPNAKGLRQSSIRGW